MTDGESVVPQVRVVRGTPTAEEVAALVGALYGIRRAHPATGPAHAPVSRWAVSTRPTVPLRAGPGAWRASALPR